MKTRERQPILEATEGLRAQYVLASTGDWYVRRPAKHVAKAYAWGAWSIADSRPDPSALKKIGRIAAVPIEKQASGAPSPRNCR